MKKTYWWRVGLMVTFVLLLVGAYMGYCDYRLSRCLWGNHIPAIRTIFHFSLSLLCISPFLFFVTDTLFKKWFWFGVVWIFISIIFIAFTPEYSGSWFIGGPEKESVSVWMASLLLLLSLTFISYETWKNRK